MHEQQFIKRKSFKLNTSTIIASKWKNALHSFNLKNAKGVRGRASGLPATSSHHTRSRRYVRYNLASVRAVELSACRRLVRG